MSDLFVATSRRHYDRAAFEMACARRGLALEYLFPISDNEEEDHGSGENDLENKRRQR